MYGHETDELHCTPAALLYTANCRQTMPPRRAEAGDCEGNPAKKYVSGQRRLRGESEGFCSIGARADDDFDDFLTTTKVHGVDGLVARRDLEREGEKWK